MPAACCLNGFFGTAPLNGVQLATVALFPFVVWGADELRRLLLRRRRAARSPAELHAHAARAALAAG